MFKIFPATLTSDRRKIPLIKNWAELATTDKEQLAIWQNIYRDRLTFWGIPTGEPNGIIVLDVDVKGNGFKSIQDHQLIIPPTMCQRTLNGGVHYVYKLPKDGLKYGNRVGIYPGIDSRGSAGYIIHYNLDKTPLAEAPRWLLDEALKTGPKFQGSLVGIEPRIAESIVQEALDNIREAPPGESNNILNVEAYRLGQLIASNAITKDYAEEALLKAATDRGKPLNEARATIKSGLDGGQAKPLTTPFGEPTLNYNIEAPTTERWTPKFFSKSDLLNFSKLKKPQLFKDWSTEDIHITTGDGGTGKTTLKLYEAVCLALGDRFLSFECKQPGKTLFITGEDTSAKLGAMLGAMLRQMNLFETNPEKVQTILDSIVVKKDTTLSLIIKDKQGFLHPNQQALNKVLEAVDDLKPKMIVFDPISSFWGSEAALNDMAKAVGRFMGELVEKSNACVEMINHMGKQSSNNKDMGQFAGRGGTGLPSNARVNRVLRSLSSEEYSEITGQELLENQSAMMCAISKFTDGSPLLGQQFIILREGYLFTRRTVDQAKVREADRRESDKERVFKFLKECRDRGKYVSAKTVIAYFQSNGDPLSVEKTKHAIRMLKFEGFDGLQIYEEQGPDALEKDLVFIIRDEEGKEI